MSLVLWLPLTDDYHNQGLNDYEISTLGTISWPSGGKLGATCLQAGNANQTSNGLRIEGTFADLLNGDHTVSVWVKPLGNHVHYNGSIFSSGNWNTPNKRWAFGVSQDNTKVDILCSNYNTYVNCAIPVNEWTHLVCTCGADRIVKLYKNGEFVVSVDRSTSNEFDSDNTFTCIGRESYANGYFSFNGCLQDFRLYDECLSPLEIKRFSQGLVLYYPMNDPYIESSQNLIKTMTIAEATESVWGGHSVNVSNYDCSSEGVPINICSRLDVTYPVNDTTGGGVSKPIGSSFTVKPSTTYTFSAYLKASDDYAYTHPNFLYYYGDTVGHGIYTSTKKEPVGNGWYRIWNTLTTGENQTSFSPYFYSYPGKSMTYWIGGWQLEEKDHLTPYIEPLNNREETIIYDSSGYCHNGIVMGNLITSVDSPRHSSSSYFNGSTYVQADPLPSEVKTVSCWVKTDKPSTNQFYWCDTGTKMCLATYNGHGTVITWYQNGGQSTGSKCTLSGSEWKSNGWNHFVVIDTGNGTRDVYCNGEKLTPMSDDWYGTSGSKLVIGNRGSGAGPLYGYVSDFRAYVTQLSESDIKALYENSAYISSNATTYAYEYVEV